MSECIQPETVPVKIGKREIMTTEKLERLAKARETVQGLMHEEKRMEVAKQFLLASAGTPAAVKSNPEEKKLKWKLRKDEIVNEMFQKLSAANMELRERKKQEDLEAESECSDAPPVKKQKTSKPMAAAEKPKSKSKRLSSHSPSSGRSNKKRKPVKPAVELSESEASSESRSSEGEVEHVLKLWQYDHVTGIWAR